ncbi:MAG: cyclic pyranopterin monophosphate synthase MoaC [Candidatus Eisenbacteria bacterium]|uniref:Cyclic pyranopterin monophosphate synthase n=1 Tax=Eiseniibacteriota bacterium TaxID=2212470 RepID=A0A938BR57_UNCEI|nr:cyclic pyranopterin monophosphate synthase MoaC [Candidatus Eisenbacteria bacterium]
MGAFTHLDERGRVRMVDVGRKRATAREAVAAGSIRMSRAALDLLRGGEIAKGNVLAVAKTAAILAAKRTAELIPLCHPLLPAHIEVDFTLKRTRIEIAAAVRLTGRTGAEMEALTAVAVAALTIYDMCKAVDRAMVIGEIRLLEKSGGRSGRYRREGEASHEPGRRRLRERDSGSRQDRRRGDRSAR